jgi:hypothetical protein
MIVFFIKKLFSLLVAITGPPRENGRINALEGVSRYREWGFFFTYPAHD